MSPCPCGLAPEASALDHSAKLSLTKLASARALTAQHFDRRGKFSARALHRTPARTLRPSGRRCWLQAQVHTDAGSSPAAAVRWWLCTFLGHQMHWWSSGRIHRCHRCDPGSIPGQCNSGRVEPARSCVYTTPFCGVRHTFMCRPTRCVLCTHQPLHDSCGVRTHALADWRLKPAPSTTRPNCHGYCGLGFV